MQTTDRIHPGGKPSPSQPPYEVPRNGRVNFHRQVPTAEEKSQAEGAVSTEQNGAAPGKGETQEVVEGRLYKWASNICHLNDTSVKVEDLSDRDIGAQLAQETQDLLSKVLKSKIEDMQVGAHFRTEQLEGITSEEFVIAGPLGEWRVCRKTYPDIDARNGETPQYSKSTIAKRISAAAADRVATAPSDPQLKYVACRLLAKDCGEISKRNDREKWQMLLGMAQEDLHNHREDAAFYSRLGDELKGIIPRPQDQTPELVDLVEKKLPRTKVNPFHQFLLDGEASEACERIEGFDIVILRDKNYELICGMFTQAVQKLFAAGTVDKMSTAAEAFAWRFPYKRPDDQRHLTNQSLHLAVDPDKDVHSKQCKQPHFAVCSVVHYGAHHEAGRRNGFDGLCFQRFDSVYNRRLLGTIAWKEEFPKLKGGVYGVAAKASRLVLEAWDPKLYEDYLEIRQHLPDSLNMTLATSGENPYGYMAQLVDTLTEGHTDTTDWMQGGDLVLKELGVRIAFPSGSNCHLRGQGLHHSISRYEGIRHSLVLTNKESVRKTAQKFDERLQREEERAAKLEAKAPTDWTDEEGKLHEAFLDGRKPLLEHTWGLIKKELDEKKRNAQNKRADKKRDCSEEPPEKRVKKTGKAH